MDDGPSTHSATSPRAWPEQSGTGTLATRDRGTYPRLVTTRDPYLDNARGLLIGLVVLGHLLTPLATREADVLNLWIYSFHMAAFVTVSGYVARGWVGSPRQAAAIVTSLVVPYVLLDLAHEAIASVQDGTPIRVTLLTPAFTLWFLIALALWRLATPVLRVLRHPLAFAVVLSLVLPFERALDSTLSLGRVVGFLPFYVLGACATPETLARVRGLGRRWRLVGGAYLVALLVVCVVVEDRVHRGWFFLDGSYRELELDPVPGLVIRALALAGGLLGTVAVLLVAPRGDSWLTRWGRNSLAIYIVHALLVRPFLGSGTLKALEGPWVVAAAVGVAAVLTAILALDPVARGVDALVRPAWLGRLLTDREAAARRGAPADAPHSGTEAHSAEVRSAEVRSGTETTGVPGDEQSRPAQ